MSSYHGGQTSKPRNKVVKPILRKLTLSEKSSLDLDRPTADQDGLGIYAEYGTGSRSAHDVTFNHTSRRVYGHNRSTSGTSQFSTATSGSHRAGSFVHPFQQTPRPYTPPLAASYQGSLRESEYSTKDSPALTDGHEDEPRNFTYRSPSNLSNHTPSLTGGATSPIAISQPHLRIQTKPSSSRLGLSSSRSSLRSTLHSPDCINPTESLSPVTGVRSSMDKGFRIRSRSEVDTRARAESIQEARRKFLEKEQAKEEKAAREEIRQREKRDQKEARQIERGHRRGSASDGGQRHKRTRSKSDLTMQEKGVEFVSRDYDSTPVQPPPWVSAMGEEGMGFEAGSNRSHTVASATKKKTHSGWTKLMMWLRTRFIRLKKKS